jgi:hypothetical protein
MPTPTGSVADDGVGEGDDRVGVGDDGMAVGVGSEAQAASASDAIARRAKARIVRGLTAS